VAGASVPIEEIAGQTATTCGRLAQADEMIKGELSFVDRGGRFDRKRRQDPDPWAREKSDTRLH